MARRTKNTSNIERLLRHTRRADLPVDTFELGNELGIAHIEALGPRIAALVAELWPLGRRRGAAAAHRRPLLAGPDDAGDGDNRSRTEFTKLVGEESYLRAITFHAYPFHHGGGPTATLVQHMMNPKLLDQGVETYAQVIGAVRAGLRPGQRPPEVWMGEGNAAGHGGRLGVTNTFINSFWYLHAMGSAASMGIGRFNRQSLIGGGYELVNRSTFQPNPDFWAALLWRRLVGTAALSVEVSPQLESNLRAHAFCAATAATASSSSSSSVVLVVLNFSPSQRANLTLLAPRHTHRRSWYVRSGLAGSALPAVAVRASHVELKGMRTRGNGTASWDVLRLGPGDALPEMAGVSENADQALVLEPQSYAFTVLDGLATNIHDCN